MADIFISYTSSDRDWAFWIAHELEALGHKARVHEWEIPGGGDIMAWMDERLDTADHVLCVVSHKYLKANYSSWERRAAHWATAKDRPNFVLPVFVELCKTPTLFAPLKRCDLHGLAEEEAHLRLKAFLEPPGKPPRGPLPGGSKSSTRSATAARSPPFPGRVGGTSAEAPRAGVSPMRALAASPPAAIAAPSRHFPSIFFKGALHFFDDVSRTSVDQTAKNLRVARIIFFQYIRNKFQIGFRAYEGLAPIQGNDGILPVPVRTDRTGPVSTVDYIQWSNGSTPVVLTSARPNYSTPSSISVNKISDPCNIAVFQFYNDPDRGVDFFRLPLNQFSSDQVLIDHYVAVRNDDLYKWNPNKFVFEVVNETLNFSNAVYASTTSQPRRSKATMARIEQLLVTFGRSDCRLGKTHCDENFKKVKERIDEIFDGKQFRSSVTVFHYQTKPRNADLILLYTFP